MLILVCSGLIKTKKIFVVAFLLYYCTASAYIIYTDKNIETLKNVSLISSVKYINELNLTSKDMVIMPFASSVISHYTTEDFPKTPRIEAIQELRVYNNKNIYSDETIEKFKTQKINDVFKEIVLSKEYISENFHNYILNTFVNPVEKGHYILFSIFATDAEVLMSDEDLNKNISVDGINDENVLNYILAKYFLDIHKIVQEKAILQNTHVVDNNVYILYKKK